jgi:hypothetical protein
MQLLINTLSLVASSSLFSGQPAWSSGASCEAASSGEDGYYQGQGKLEKLLVAVL